MRFPRDMAIPTRPQLKTSFIRYGPMVENSILIFRGKCCAQVSGPRTSFVCLPQTPDFKPYDSESQYICMTIHYSSPTQML